MTHTLGTPTVDADAIIAPSASVTGDVTLAEGVSVWHGCVVRGDVEPITIGKDTNIQDLSCIHGTSGLHGATIGERVTVGHRAIVHACVVEDEVLIGMGSIILDGARISKHTIIAAGAVVSPGTVTESGFMYAGIPAKKIRPLKEHEYAQIQLNAAHYVDLRSTLEAQG